MNQTAKKLREAAHHMSGNTLTLVQVIRQVREKLDVEETDTFGGDLVAILIAIADELDELQARAAGANNLRQQLESAEDKAERRKRHIGYLDTALHDKNVLFKQREEALAKVTEENAELRKQVPSERERRILDMWPRFEDGAYVWFGDGVEFDPIYGGGSGVASAIEFMNCTYIVKNYISEPIAQDGFEVRAKRPAPKVLDADGVEIKVGDTVWFKGNPRPYAVVEVKDGSVRLHSKTHCSEESATTVWTDILTHIAPDSWERCVEDMQKSACAYFGYQHKECDEGDGCPARGALDCSNRKMADLIRRAKALAGAEAGR